MSMIEDAILKLDAKLSSSNLRYAFLGGSVLSLLVTDSSAAAIRVTKDIDVMVNVRTESNPENRKRCILEKFWKVAALSAPAPSGAS